MKEVKYRTLEGIATADVAYEVYGKSLAGLFANAAEAVTQTMADIETLKPSKNSEFRIQNLELKELLLDFLNKLVFLKDSKQLLFSRFYLIINKLDARRYTLNADMWGEKIDPAKHKLRCDVKAVTRHHLEIKKDKMGYKTIIVLDI